MKIDETRFFKELLDQVSDGVYLIDHERRIRYWNQGASRLTGYTAEEVLGKNCQDDLLCHVDLKGTRLCHQGCPMLPCLSGGGSYEANVFLRHKRGRRVPVAIKVQPLRDDEGSVVGAIQIFRDDSARVDASRRTEAMERLAFLDHLTKLPNRRFLEMKLQTAVNEFAVHHDPFGVLAIDIDRFKEINDVFGHDSGDHALQEVGKTLVGALRPTDTVGRWGGDEFLAIVRNVNLEILGKLAERCIALVGRTSLPAEDGRRISLSISAGAALYCKGESARQLLARADVLMYRSKACGRDCVTAA